MACHRHYAHGNCRKRTMRETTVEDDDSRCTTASSLVGPVIQHRTHPKFRRIQQPRLHQSKCLHPSHPASDNFITKPTYPSQPHVRPQNHHLPWLLQAPRLPAAANPHPRPRCQGHHKPSRRLRQRARSRTSRSIREDCAAEFLVGWFLASR